MARLTGQEATRFYGKNSIDRIRTRVSPFSIFCFLFTLYFKPIILFYAHLNDSFNRLVEMCVFLMLYNLQNLHVSIVACFMDYLTYDVTIKHKSRMCNNIQIQDR